MCMLPANSGPWSPRMVTTNTGSTRSRSAWPETRTLNGSSPARHSRTAAARVEHVDALGCQIRVARRFARVVDRVQIRAQHVRRRPVGADRPRSSQTCRWHISSTAARLCETNTIGGPALVANLEHASQRPILKRRVADRQHFVDQQHVRVDVDRHRERQAGIHAAREVLDRRLHEVSASRRSRRSARSARCTSCPAQAEDDPVEQHVLAAGQLRVKARADVQQRRHPPFVSHPATVGRVMPASKRSVVVLPAPLRPTRPSDSPRATAGSESRTAHRSLRRSRRPSMSSSTPRAPRPWPSR